MKGHTEVVDYLKHLLKGELAARDQYFIHSRLYEDWGFSKLYSRPRPAFRTGGREEHQ